LSAASHRQIDDSNAPSTDSETHIGSEWLGPAPGYPFSAAESEDAVLALAGNAAFAQAMEWAGRYFSGLLDVVPLRGEIAYLSADCAEASGSVGSGTEPVAAARSQQNNDSAPSFSTQATAHSVLPIAQSVAETFGLHAALLATRAAAATATSSFSTSTPFVTLGADDSISAGATNQNVLGQ